MAFGICRARNLKFEDIQSTDKHNARLYSSPEEFPQNIDPQKQFAARYLLKGEDGFLYPGESSLHEAIQHRLDKENVKGIRKNSNVAIEYVLAVSDTQDVWGGTEKNPHGYSPTAFFEHAAAWIEERHGKDSVVSIAEHYDESNPHMHIIVVPLITKDVNWKNKNGSGKRRETRLNTRVFTGGAEKLRKLQDDYHQFCKPWGARLGVDFIRGTKVENQTKEYVQQTDHRIGRIRAILKRFEVDMPHLLESVRKSIKKRIESLKSHLFDVRVEHDVAKVLLLQEEKKQRDKSKGQQWKNRGPQADVGIDPQAPEYKSNQGLKAKQRKKNNPKPPSMGM